MTAGLGKLVVPGRHTRKPRASGLRRVSLAVLIMLVVQYGLGIILNLYVAVPASDAHAGFLQEIRTAPLALTAHALLGLVLIGTAILLVAKAVSMRDRLFAVLAGGGLAAILGAFVAGEVFVRNGEDSESLAMAILTGVALLCYISAFALVSTARRDAVQPLRHPGARPVPSNPYPAAAGPAAPWLAGTAGPPVAARRPAPVRSQPGTRPRAAVRPQAGPPSWFDRKTS